MAENAAVTALVVDHGILERSSRNFHDAGTSIEVVSEDRITYARFLYRKMTQYSVIYFRSANKYRGLDIFFHVLVVAISAVITVLTPAYNNPLTIQDIIITVLSALNTIINTGLGSLEFGRMSYERETAGNEYRRLAERLGGELATKKLNLSKIIDKLRVLQEKNEHIDVNTLNHLIKENPDLVV